MSYFKKDSVKYFENIMKENALNIPLKDKFFVSGYIPFINNGKDIFPFISIMDALKDIKIPFNIDDLVDIYCGYMWIFFVTKYNVYISYTKEEQSNIILCFENLLYPKDIILSPTLYVKKIASGCDHSMILLSDGTLFALGKNTHGQLGIISDNSEQFMINPAIISKDNFANQNIIDVVCGYYHTLVLTNDGTLYVTGRNTESQIGQPANKNLYKFEKITYADENDNIHQYSGDKCLAMDPTPGFAIKKIASSSHNSFFLTHNGILYGTGDKRFNSMGNRVNATFKAIQIPDIIDQLIVDIWCTSLATFIKLDNGNIFMVGSNRDNAMFTNDSCVEEFKLNKYLSNKSIIQMRGLYSTIALSDNDHNIYVSGYNYIRQLMNTEQKNVISEHNLELSRILQKYPNTNINIQSGFRACSISFRGGEDRYTKYICHMIYCLYKSIYNNDSHLSDIDTYCVSD